MPKTSGPVLAARLHEALATTNDSGDGRLLLLGDMPQLESTDAVRGALSRWPVTVLGSRGVLADGTASLYLVADRGTWTRIAEALAGQPVAWPLSDLRPDDAASKVRVDDCGTTPVDDAGYAGWEITLHPDLASGPPDGRRRAHANTVASVVTAVEAAGGNSRRGYRGAGTLTYLVARLPVGDDPAAAALAVAAHPAVRSLRRTARIGLRGHS